MAVKVGDGTTGSAHYLYGGTDYGLALAVNDDTCHLLTLLMNTWH